MITPPTPPQEGFLAPILVKDAYLIGIDGEGNENVEKISQSQAGDENIGPIPHAFVLVDDPEQGGVADDAHDEDGAGHKGVDVLEGLPDFCPLCTHDRELWGLRDGIPDC